MAGYDGSVRFDTQINTKNASSQLLRLENQISKAARKASDLTEKMREMEKQTTPTDAYKNLQNDLEKANNELQSLVSNSKEWEDIGITSGLAFDKLRQKITAAEENVHKMTAEMEKMKANGTAFISKDAIHATDEYKKLSSQLRDTNEQMQVLARRHEELAAKENKVSGSAKSAGKSTGNWLDNFSGKTRKASGLVSAFASRIKGIALSLFIFNWITQGWNAMISAVKDGTQNMAKYSSDVNAKMSALVSAVATLKNAFGALAAPIISAVGPALTYLINMLTAAINKVNQFISALTGKKTWTKATTQTKNYAAGLDAAASKADKATKAAKKLKGQLQSFNELNVIDSNKDSGSGGSGGGGGVGDLYEEVPIDQNIADLADKIREAIKSGDWEGLGSMIQTKLCDAVDNIKWKKIYTRADHFGINFAKFLNGLFKTDKKGRSVFTATAKVIASSLNTALHFLNSFGETFDWKEFGKSFAKGIRTFFTTWDAGLTGKTFSTFVKGLLEAITSAIRTTSEDKTWKDIGQDIADFICGVDWSGITFDFVDFWDALKDALIQWPQDLVSGFAESLAKSIFGEDAGKKIKEFVDGFYDTPVAKALSKFNIQMLIDSVPAFKAIDDLITKIKSAKSITDLFNSIKNGNKDTGKKKQKATTLDVIAMFTGWKKGKKFKNNIGDMVASFAKWILANKFGKTIADMVAKFGKWVLAHNFGKTIKDMIAKFVKWELDSKFGKIISGMIAKFLKWVLDSKFGKTIPNMIAKLAKWILGDGFGKTISGFIATLFGWKKGDKFKKTIPGFTAQLIKFSDLIRGRKTLSGFTANIVSFTNKIANKALDFVANITGAKQKKTAKKAGGGIYTGGMWHNIAHYAVGTENAPAGQLFIAREAGPELVGTIAGHTSVMNNDQIVASVSDGVARAVRSVMASGNQNVNVVFKVEGDPNGIFHVTQQKANEYYRATGNPAFLF